MGSTSQAHVAKCNGPTTPGSTSLSNAMETEVNNVMSTAPARAGRQDDRTGRAQDEAVRLATDKGNVSPTCSGANVTKVTGVDGIIVMGNFTEKIKHRMSSCFGQIEETNNNKTKNRLIVSIF